MKLMLIRAFIIKINLAHLVFLGIANCKNKRTICSKLIMMEYFYNNTVKVHQHMQTHYKLTR